jgi:hypothetical protein
MAGDVGIGPLVRRERFRQQTIVCPVHAHLRSSVRTMTVNLADLKAKATSRAV